VGIEIRQHQPSKDLKDFMRVPFEVYADDPAWVPPLNVHIKERLSPAKNPFFEHAEVALFTAWKDGKLVGRISAQVDHEHLRIHEDDVGFFGFFDTIEDQEVATALVDAAAEWLASRGMRAMRGPCSLSINDEAGLLIEGFDKPPVIMSPHNRPYQAALAEGAGLRKVKDCYSWWYDISEPTPRAQKAWEMMAALPEVRFRTVNRKKLDTEAYDILDVYNDAFQHNWGFVPATNAEAEKLAKDLGPIGNDLSFFADIDGRPVGICIALPNLNEVIRDFNGRLTPLNVLKLLWRLKVKGPKSGRFILLGIRTELRHKRRYAPLAMAICAELMRRSHEMGYEWGELGWTLEDNHAVNVIIRRSGGRIYKRYRLYEKAIGGD
jgi:GNAT superfamily N-acetyltransferase